MKYFYFFSVVLLFNPSIICAIHSDANVHEEDDVDSNTGIINIPPNFVQNVQTNISQDATLAIIQVHSFLYPVEFCYNDSVCVNGTNIGLSFPSPNKTLSFSIKNNNNAKVSVLQVVVEYKTSVSIPGGIIEGSSIGLSSYPYVNYTNSLTKLNINATSYNGKNSTFTYTWYHLYGPENNITAESYFESISRMITPKLILQNAAKDISSSSALNSSYASYPRVGSVYVVVVTDDAGHKSAYIPALTYGCNPLIESTCSYLTYSGVEDIFFYILCFLGIIIAFTGLASMQVLVFIYLLTGFSSAYIFQLDYQYFFKSSFILFGTVAVLVWILFRLIAALEWVIAILFSHIMSILLFTSTVFYLCPSFSILALSLGITYWKLFTIMVIILFVVTISFSACKFPIAIAATGSYVIFLSYDYCINTSLKYLMVDQIRRVTVEGFSTAIIDPPIQQTERILLICILAVTLIGAVIQRCSGCGSGVAGSEDETVPLIGVIRRTGGKKFTDRWERRTYVEF